MIVIGLITDVLMVAIILLQWRASSRSETQHDERLEKDKKQRLGEYTLEAVADLMAAGRSPKLIFQEAGMSGEVTDDAFAKTFFTSYHSTGANRPKRELLDELHNALDGFEQVAYGVKAGLYDIALFDDLVGERLVQSWKVSEAYVRRLRKQDGEAYQEFQSMIVLLLIRQAESARIENAEVAPAR